MKKRISFPLFLTVLWRGFCQALTYIGGLFGYRKDSRLARTLWGISSFCLTTILSIITFMFVWAFFSELLIPKVKKLFASSSSEHTEYSITNRLSYWFDDKGNITVYDKENKEALLEDIQWLNTYKKDKDSLLVFAKDDKRGYLNINSAKVQIPAEKYTRAWIFSEGVAVVEEDGVIKFIDPQNNVLADNVEFCIISGYEYVFHNGGCIVENPIDLTKRGLMDKHGKWLISPEYDRIEQVDSSWVTIKNESTRLLSHDFKLIKDFGDNTTEIISDKIYVYDKDNLLSCYDAEGKLLYDDLILGTEEMTYYTGEIRYDKEISYDENDNASESNVSMTKVQATARRLKYYTSYGSYGLMSRDGRKITKPIYYEIDAIGEDLYTCTIGDYKIIINGNGERIE